MLARENGWDAMPEDNFDAWDAQHYEVLWPELFDRRVVDSTVDVLAQLAGRGVALELGIGTGRIALPLSRRGTRVDGIELSAPMLERLKAEPGASAIHVTQGDFATTRLDRAFDRLSHPEHDHQPDHTGRTGRGLPQRRAAPGAWRLLSDRDLRSTAAAAPVRRDHVRLHRDADPPRLRGIRPGAADCHLAPLLAGRRRASHPVHAASLPLARGARPDGAPGRPQPA